MVSLPLEGVICSPFASTMAVYDKRNTTDGIGTATRAYGIGRGFVSSLSQQLSTLSTLSEQIATFPYRGRIAGDRKLSVRDFTVTEWTCPRVPDNSVQEAGSTVWDSDLITRLTVLPNPRKNSRIRHNRQAVRRVRIM